MTTTNKAVSDLKPDDMFDMQPVYEDFGLTDTSDYLASQSELAVIETTDYAESVNGRPAMLVHFHNFPSFKLPAGYRVLVEDEGAE